MTLSKSRAASLALVREPGFASGLAWTAAAVAAPTLLKVGLDLAFANVPPFLAYFPAMTMAALFLGWRWATTVVVCIAAVCDYFFIAPLRTWSLTQDDFAAVLLFVVAGLLIVVIGEMLRRSARRLQSAAAREHELNAELRHRVNNNLVIVQLLARQIFQRRASAEDFYASFSNRLHALREAHDVLAQTDWASCDLPRLAERGLRGLLPESAVSLDGPSCRLPAESCVPLMLALHELSVNALTHGALSVPSGRVDLSWRLEGDQLHLLWIEQSGPVVVAPARKGLGARLLAPQTGLDQVAVEYPPEGLRCAITISGARSS